MSEQTAASYSDFKERLDEIVEAVSDEDISLDDALALYEEAVKVGLKLSDRLESDISEQEAADASDADVDLAADASDAEEEPAGEAGEPSAEIAADEGLAVEFDEPSDEPADEAQNDEAV